MQQSHTFFHQKCLFLNAKKEFFYSPQTLKLNTYRKIEIKNHCKSELYYLVSNNVIFHDSAARIKLNMYLKAT